MTVCLCFSPADTSDGLSVLEAAKASGVVECFHEHFRQLLFVLCALVLLFTMFQQHVNLRVQQRLCTLKLCNTIQLQFIRVCGFAKYIFFDSETVKHWPNYENINLCTVYSQPDLNSHKYLSLRVSTTNGIGT